MTVPTKLNKPDGYHHSMYYDDNLIIRRGKQVTIIFAELHFKHLTRIQNKAN